MKYAAPILFLTLSSCVTEAVMYDRQYVIENGTSAPVELQFYEEGELAFRYGITPLAVGERVEGLKLERSGGPWDELSSEQLEELPTRSFDTDSVRVIFNNSKVSFFTEKASPTGAIFNPTDRNLLRDSDYTDIGGDRFLFTLNDTDVENAADCNRDCE